MAQPERPGWLRAGRPGGPGCHLGCCRAYPLQPQFQNPGRPESPRPSAHPWGPTSSAGTCSRSSCRALYVSLKIACVAVAIAGVIGTVAGIVAGYLGRWTRCSSCASPTCSSPYPAIVLALAIVTALGAGWLNSALAIGIGYIPIFVRVVRGPVLSLRAGGLRPGRARCSASHSSRLLFRHILPEHRRHRGRADQPGPGLGGPG